jgi:oxygen-independent coproporphyrinogen-3 oxidase
MQAPWLQPRAAYVHVPFCAHRCDYCDFAIAVAQEQWIELYVDALEAELTRLGDPHPVETLFLGGGTPTLLEARQLDRLLTILNRWLPLAPHASAGDQQTCREFSVEANPGSLDVEKVEVLADHGVNRISLGAQSFQPRLLAVLGRDHAPADVARAVETARRRIDNVSLDLIFGVPGQTSIEWQADLDEALSLAPDHVSTYGLTYEKGTPLWKQWKRGSVQPLEEEAERSLYNRAMDVLEAAGFEHYEISNFAQPGRRCRHNETYWANHAYLGFGMGAARYIGGRREMNTRDLKGYIRKALSGESAVFQSEELSPEDRARETLTLGLRRAEGVNRAAFLAQTDWEVDALAGKALPQLIDWGLVCDDAAGIRLTREGKYVADEVMKELW